MVHCLPAWTKGCQVAKQRRPAKLVSSAPVVVVVGGVGMGLAVDLVIPLVRLDTPGVAREPAGAGRVAREVAGGKSREETKLYDMVTRAGDRDVWRGSWRPATHCKE